MHVHLLGYGKNTLVTADKLTGALKTMGMSKGEVRLRRGLTLAGGARARFPRRLELAEVSLTSDATLAESESRSSVDPPALLEA